MHERERCVVADGADVAEMVGQPLQLRHQRAQIGRARRHFDLQGGFGGQREGIGIGDRAVAGAAAGKLGGAFEGSARHQALDALVHIAEALLQAHHVLAIGGEAEVARLDDAGMHGTDRDLVQALAFHRQERIRRRAFARVSACRADGGRPRSRDRARAACRAQRSRSSPHRSWMARSRRMAAGCLAPTLGYLPSLHSIAHDRDVAGALIEQRHVHMRRVAPQRQQRARPPANSSIAFFQPASATVTRGQGRCAGAA